MNFRIYFTSISLYFGLHLCWTQNSQYFKIINQKQLISTFETLSRKSVHECAASCLQNAQTSGACLSTNFNSGSQTCELSSSTGSGPDLIDVADEKAFVLIPLNPDLCPTPQPLTNGSYILSGDTVTYTCETGHVLVGQSMLACIEGSWSGTPPFCLQDCGAFNNSFRNTEIAVYPTCTHEGCTLAVQCLVGFKDPIGLTEPVQIVCRSGIWTSSALSPDCSYELVFRGTAENGYDINEAYLYGSVIDGVTSDMMCMDVHNTSCSLHYRNSRIDSWTTLGISWILYEMYSGGTTVLSIVFDGTGSNMTTWMGNDVAFKAISWPWTDMTPSTTSWWSLFGDINNGRTFRILEDYNSCNDMYFSVVLYEPSNGCNYEMHRTWPRFLYSDATGSLDFNTEEESPKMKPPQVRKLGPGVITWKRTDEAARVEEENKKRAQSHALSHDEVHKQAEETAKGLGLQGVSMRDLWSFYTIQFGKYQGQTFRWLAENDMGYVTYLLQQVADEGGNTGSGTLNDNKRQLKWYLQSFPDGRAAILQRQRETKSSKQAPKRPLRVVSPSSTPSHTTGPPEKKKTPAKPTQEEMDDSELLSQVETLEASQTSSQPEIKTEPEETPPVTPATTTPSKTTQSPVTPAKQSKTPSSQVLSPTRPLSQLRTVSSLLASLTQPDEFPLPADWKKALPDCDKKWLSKAICRYNAHGKLEVQPTQLWYHPPQPALIPSQSPCIDRYFAHSLFVWMPKLLWHVRFNCPKTDCGKELSRAGNHGVVRQVLAIDSYYLMVTERYICSGCKMKYLGWSGPIVSQLDISRRVQFPVLLTYRYACDESVVSLLRSRGIGNSASQIQKKVDEQHSRKFLGQAAHYLSDCRGMAESSLLIRPVFDQPPSPVPVPQAKWFMHVYCLDVMSRIDEVKASITSTFGRVLKMDSTKKVAKKLAGASRDTAAWDTNVGNEDGQVLISVVTCTEGHFGLKPMVDGLVSRYASADVPPPEALYVDRDCCGESFTSTLFRAWPNLQIRLDIWHFMRRFSAGCTTDAHAKYSDFMKGLSKCIFEWSGDDLRDLSEAKRSELRQRGVNNPSDKDVLVWLSKSEKQLHCRRRTRGTEETTRLLEELLEAYHGTEGLDTLGVPLFEREKMINIWESQKRHVKCIQDPDGISLYTQTGSIKKGGVSLPTFRCARGSVSLESFHNHLAKFVPGTTASETHFQAFLLEGLRRWNEDRTRQAYKTSSFQTYSGLLRHAVNDLSQAVLKKRLVPEYKAPRKFTGEKIGVEYLFSQTGKVLQDILSDPENENFAQFDENRETADREEGADNTDGEDEGFEDQDPVEDDPTLPPVDMEDLRSPQQPTAPQDQPAPSATQDQPAPVRPSTSTGTATHTPTGDQRLEQTDSSDAVDAINVGGYSRADRLAEFLFSLRDQTEPISADQASHIIRLWNELDDYDKQPTVPNPRHRTQLTKGSVTTFKVRSKASCVPGVDSVKRAFHGTEGGIAQRPDSNRIMELLIIKLCGACPSPRKEKGQRIDRWNQVSRAYRHIRELFLACNTLLEETRIVLFAINHATLIQWYSKRVWDQEQRMLRQNRQVQDPPMEAQGQLPPARVRDPVAETQPVPPGEQHKFPLPPYTVGTSGRARKRVVRVSESPADPESSYVRTPVPVRPSSSAPMSAPRLVPIAPVSAQRPTPTEPMAVSPITLEPIPIKKLPKTTRWNRIQKEKKRAAGEYVRDYTQQRAERTYKCGKCGCPRTADTGHRQYCGKWWCEKKDSQTWEEFESSGKKSRQERLLKKKEAQEKQQEQLDVEESQLDD